jgi:hypothetical protein
LRVQTIDRHVGWAHEPVGGKECPADQMYVPEVDIVVGPDMLMVGAHTGSGVSLR